MTQPNANPSSTPASPSEYRCTICSYIYTPAKGDPSQHIPPHTPFEALPEKWICPSCRAPRRYFVKLD